MLFFRTLLALIFATLLANPAYCRPGIQPETSCHMSCCGGESEKSPAHDCSCLSQLPPQNAEDPPATVPAGSFAIEPVLEATPLPTIRWTPAPAILSSPSVWNDTGPPSLRLALLQRRLI
jgi:hypothetical protein